MLQACVGSGDDSDIKGKCLGTTQEGILINQHLGEARTFPIRGKSENGFEKNKDRTAPATGGGIKRRHQVARVLGDCRAVLVGRVGQVPFDILKKSGMKPVEASGFIEDGLCTVYDNRDTCRLKGSRNSCADKYMRWFRQRLQLSGIVHRLRQRVCAETGNVVSKQFLYRVPGTCR